MSGQHTCTVQMMMRQNSCCHFLFVVHDNKKKNSLINQVFFNKQFEGVKSLTQIIPHALEDFLHLMSVIIGYWLVIGHFTAWPEPPSADPSAPGERWTTGALHPGRRRCAASVPSNTCRKTEWRRSRVESRSVVSRCVDERLGGGAYIWARGKSPDTPAPPYTCMAQSTTLQAILAAATLISAI